MLHFLLLIRWTRTIKEKEQRLVGYELDNVSAWVDMSIRGLLFQWASTKKIQLILLVYYKATSSSSHWKLTCFRRDIVELMLNTNPITH
jgi:hypothetical protein